MRSRRVAVRAARVWSVLVFALSTAAALAAEPTPKPTSDPHADLAAAIEASIAGSPAPTPTPTATATGETPPLVAPPLEAPPVAEAPSAPSEQSFRVRQAVIGQGFEFGATGRLLVGEEGISFTPQGGKAGGWTIAWRDLATAAPAEGVWDSPSPVLLAERSGLRRFVARIDGKDRHLPREPLLKAIEEGRKKFRQTRESADLEMGRKGVGP